MLAKSTKSDHVIKFMRKIRLTMTKSNVPETTAIHLVLDNARAHKTILVRNQCSRSNIVLDFQPSYSPEFNCCEPMWLVLKRRFKYKLAVEKHVILQQRDLERLLKELLSQYTPEEASRAARHNNRAFMHRMLTGVIEVEESDE